MAILLEQSDCTTLQAELAEQIQQRTGRRVKDLLIEIYENCVVLYGQTTSWYVKQVAQHSVLTRLPHLRIRNDILVEAA